MHRDLVEDRVDDVSLLVEGRDHLVRNLEIDHAGPSAVRDEFVPVLLGFQADGRGLDPQRQVLRHQYDGVPGQPVVLGNRQDPGVVVTKTEAVRQAIRVGVVELNEQFASLIVDRHRPDEAAVVEPQLVEDAQRCAGEMSQFWMVAFALQLGDDDDRHHHVMLGEVEQGTRIRQQHRCVDDVGPPPLRCRRDRAVGSLGAFWTDGHENLP